MKTIYRSIGLTSILLIAGALYAPRSEAQSKEVRCTTWTAFEFGKADGRNGRLEQQVDKRIETCQKYGVALDRQEYMRGLTDGHALLCTAANGKADRADNQQPKRACNYFDNPYMWEFRGTPLTRMPEAGAASIAKAEQEISDDINLLKNAISRAERKDYADSYESAAYSILIDRLEGRIVVLEKTRSGQSIVPSAVNSPGPKHRAGMSGGEMVSGLFKTSNWKSGDDLSPMRIRKKNCKKGKWEEYGEQHGRFAADIDEEIAVATKKCAKHDITFDEAAYRIGYDKAVADHCGYEQGFFNALKDKKAPKVCQSGRFPTYSKGYRHGEIRANFVNVDSEIFGMKDLYKGVVKAYNGKSVLAYPVLSSIHVPSTFGNGKDMTRFIANERIRLNALEAELDAHKAQYPELYQEQELGVEPRPDRELDYPIPN